MTITFQAVGAQASTDGTSIAPALPAGFAAGDIHLLAAGTRSTGLFTTPVGWTLVETKRHAALLRVGLWWRRAQAGDAAPAVVCSTSASLAGEIAGWRGAIAGGDPFDTARLQQSGPAAASFSPAAITTMSNGAMAVVFGFSADDNALSVSGSGWSAAYSGASYDTTDGGDQAHAAAYKLMASPGSAGQATFTETVNGNDGWCAITVALRESASVGDGGVVAAAGGAWGVLDLASTASGELELVLVP